MSSAINNFGAYCTFLSTVLLLYSKTTIYLVVLISPNYTRNELRRCASVMHRQWLISAYVRLITIHRRGPRTTPANDQSSALSAIMVSVAV